MHMAVSASPSTIPKATSLSKPGWRARARYGFDNIMSRGTPALIGLLGRALPQPG